MAAWSPRKLKHGPKVNFATGRATPEVRKLTAECARKTVDAARRHGQVNKRGYPVGYKQTAGGRRTFPGIHSLTFYVQACSGIGFLLKPMNYKVTNGRSATQICLCGPTAVNEKRNQLLSQNWASKNCFRFTGSMKSSRAKAPYPLCLVGKKRQETARGNPTIPPDKARRAGAASPVFVQTQS